MLKDQARGRRLSHRVVMAAVFPGRHSGGGTEELVEVADAAVTEAAGNIQHGQIGGGEQALRLQSWAIAYLQ